MTNELREFFRQLFDIEVGLPISTTSQEFGDGLVCYITNPKGEWYAAALPPNAHIRLCIPINDEKLKPHMRDAMEAAVGVLQYISTHSNTLPPPIADRYRWVHFESRDMEDAYYQFLYAPVIRSSRLILNPIGDPSPAITPLLTDEGLLPLKEFESRGEYFVVRNGSAAFLPCYSTRDSRERILELLRTKGTQCDVYVAPAEYVDVSRVSDTEIVTEAKIFGESFSEELFQNLLETQGASYSYDQHEPGQGSMFTPMYELQYKVSPISSTETSLIMEEVIDVTLTPESRLNGFVFKQSNAEYVRDRLVHAIYDKSKRCFTHLDLSFLYFELTDASYWKRIETAIWKKTVPASEKRKVFRVDGMLSFADGCNLIGAGLDGARNPEVINLLKDAKPRENGKTLAKTKIDVI